MVQCPVPARPRGKHGTQYSYRVKGCRCDKCRAWKNADQRAYMRRRIERGA